jgi:hypothetical protein
VPGRLHLPYPFKACMPLRPASLLFAGTIFTSAFLLFLVQPIMAKQILPWFGGSAAVWTLCMVFFQVVLLAGYAYADWSIRHLLPSRQALLHGVLLLASPATLPILAHARWKPAADSDPTLAILGLLVATIGLPYFLLSSTGPLLQAWLARAPWASSVYRLFSLSNLASLVALLAYPVVIEPTLRLRDQAVGWSVGFGVFVALCLGSAMVAARMAPRVATTEGGGVVAPDEDTSDDTPPTRLTQTLWLLLPALGTWLLLAVTNQITQNVASIPFLWVLPLAAYLFTFVLCFESDRWYRRPVWLPLAAAGLMLSAYGLVEGLGSAVRTGVPLYVGTMFVLCMVLHGEMARLRPGHRYLTRFYLMLSAGGALGGIAVGLGAPVLLTAYYELGLGLALTAALGLLVWRGRRLPMLAAGVLALWCAVFLGRQVNEDLEGARVAERNFYGTLQVHDVDTDTPKEATRVLLHGSVKHGEQYLDPARRREPTAYYGATAGIGRALQALTPEPARVGLIGLGAGTLATYGRPGDVYRLYEINPRVFALARSEFSFLADSRATLEEVLGDARLALEREAPQRFDVLAVDAFSGGAIPVHLITAEAIDVYLRHLQERGVLAFHLTNRFLDLPPVLFEIARSRGLHAMLVHDDAADSDLRVTDWVLLSRDPAVLQRHAAFSRAPSRIPGLRVWTDDDHNLLGVLK